MAELLAYLARELVVLVELLDPDGVGIVHELAREVFEQLRHR